MELNEFVENALTQLLEGVIAAQSKAAKIVGEISPHILDDNQIKLGFLNASGQSASVIKFDVALSVSEGSGTNAGINVLGGAINLGAGGQSAIENSTVSRIQFSVPIVLPRNS